MLTEEEIKLLKEMKDNCIKQANYVDPNAMLKYNLLRKIERLNNIINELEKFIVEEMSDGRSETHLWLMGCYDEDKKILDKLKELKDSDKE